MTSNEILKADVLDILFDNRNKKYGAYLLRKYYNNRLKIALGGMLGFVFILVLIVCLNPSVRNAISETFNSQPVTVVSLPPVEPPPPPPPSQPSTNNLRHVNYGRIEIVNEPTNMPDIADVQKSVISDYTKGGDPTDGQPTSTEVVSETIPAAHIENPPPPPPAPTSAAEFPGGQKAWTTFLNRYLRTPDELEAGQKKTVQVRFSVGEDGTITQFEIVQSGGAVFDNEVIRVLRKMPKWKPAIQNGHAVPVTFTQPVTFLAFEE